MKIIIGETINELVSYIHERDMVNIEDINDSNIDELLEKESLAVIGAGQTNAQRVLMMVNSRPNESKSLTLIQQHPDLLLLVDQEGAALIYE